MTRSGQREDGVPKSPRGGVHEVAFLTRFPQEGRVKTRLVPALGREGAAALHADLARSCLDSLRPLAAADEARLVAHVDGGSRRARRRLLGAGVEIVSQPEGDLGARIEAAV